MTFSILGSLTWLGTGSPSQAQCGGGWLEQTTGWRATGWLWSSTWWDPDGSGPQPERLVIAQINENETGSRLPLIWWDGEAWHSVGGTIYGANALANDHGTLFAATASSVSRLDNENWNILGTGDDVVNSLAIYHGSLYAAGRFTKINGTPLNRIARWDGAMWQPLGVGLDDSAAAMIVFGDRLIVSGSFQAAGGSPASRVAAWDGENWSPLGEGLNGWVATLGTYQGRLIAGGGFTGSGSTAVASLAMFDGTGWVPLTTAITGSISSMSADGANLYALGPSTVGGVSAKGFARWNGSSWKPLGLGSFRPAKFVEARNNEVFVGGDVENVGPDLAAGLVRLVNDQWRGVGWQAQGSGRAVVKLSTGTYAAFYSSYNRRGSISKWNGLRWVDVFKPTSGAIYAITEFNGDIVISFAPSYTGTPGVWRWNGSDWEGLGTGLRGSVYALATFRGQLYGVGNFSTTAGAKNLARLEAAAWQPVGLPAPMASWIPSMGSAADLKVHGDRLYVSGGFDVASGGVGDGVAAWDGSSWTNAGATTLGAARVMAVHGGDLFVASADRVWRRDEVTWAAVGSRFNLDAAQGGILGLSSIQQGLLAYGGIASNTDAPGTPLRSISLWDGGAWQPLGGGFEDLVKGVVQNNDELLAVGHMSIVESRVADGWARWSFTGAPTIGTQPQAISAASGDTVRLVARAPDGYRNVVARWFHDDAPVVDGPAGASIGGGIVQGSHTDIDRTVSSQEIALQIHAVRSSDAGGYHVMLTNDCGQAVSLPAMLTLTCEADFNGDGFLSFEDFDAFIAAFEAGSGRSDANADSFLTFEDVDAFVAAFEAGC